MNEFKETDGHKVEGGSSTLTCSREVRIRPETCGLSLATQRHVLRKIDLRVAVTLGILNCISLMDRGNLAAAAVAGMNKELDLQKDHRYSIVALVFFIPYLVFEFPSTILARRGGARPLLISISILWGIVMIGTGFVRDWKQLAGLRVLLGFFESAFYPVVVFLLSSWYTRYEIQKRCALFLLVTVSISSFSGFLVVGFMQMNGLAGVSGWRWTFIMEGVLTVLVGVIAGSLIVDFPDRARSNSKFLTPEQFEWVIRRLRDDRDDVDAEPFSWSKFLKPAQHLHVWLFGIVFCCCTTVAYCVSFFLPIILHTDMGFDKTKALCLIAPPYLFAAFPMYIAGWMGDKYRVRGPILLFNSVVAIVGLALLGWTKGKWVRYFSLFVISSGILSNIPTATAYQANNVRGQWVRAFASATFVIGGGLGGVFGSLLFGDGSASATKNGIGACIAANIVIVLIVLGLTVFFSRQNRLARQGTKLIYERPGFYYCL